MTPWSGWDRAANVGPVDAARSESMTARVRFKGVFPVAPTTFDDAGELDLDS